MSDNQDILAKINATTAQPASAAPGGESAWGRAFDGQHAQQFAQQLQGAQNVATAGSQMLAAAKAGHFAVEPSYARQLVKGLQAEVDRLRALDTLVAQLTREVKLGETPAALKVAPWFLNNVATNGPHSFVPNHRLAVQGLADMAQAIEMAMGNYRATDDGSAGRFKHVD